MINGQFNSYYVNYVGFVAISEALHQKINYLDHWLTDFECSSTISG